MGWFEKRRQKFTISSSVVLATEALRQALHLLLGQEIMFEQLDIDASAVRTVQTAFDPYYRRTVSIRTVCGLLGPDKATSFLLQANIPLQREAELNYWYVPSCFRLKFLGQEYVATYHDKQGYPGYDLYVKRRLDMRKAGWSGTGLLDRQPESPDSHVTLA